MGCERCKDICGWGDKQADDCDCSCHYHDESDDYSEPRR